MDLILSDLSLEKDLLSFILNDEKYIKIAIDRIIDDNVFSDEKCKEVFSHIKKYYCRYLTFPTLNILENIFSDIYSDDQSKFQDIMLFIKQLKNKQINPEEFNFILDKLLYLYLSRRLIITLNTNVKNISDIHKAYDNIEDIIFSTKKMIEIQNFRKFEINSMLAERLKYYDQKTNSVKGILTGIKKLDELTGGWRPGELIIISAVTGEGKSALLLNFGENANKISKINVALFVLEMSYEQEIERYHSLVTGINYHKIRNQLLTYEEKREYYKKICLRLIDKEDKEKFKKWFKDIDINKIDICELDKEIQNKFKMRKEKFYIYDIPRGCTVKLIELEIKNILKKHDCPLIIIDHLNRMEPDFRTKDYWRDLGMIARQLKGLARNYNITILTAAQLGVVKPGEKITTEHIKYARMLAEEADYLIGFKVNEEDKILGRIRLELTKHRHTEESIIPIKQMFSRMKVEDF